MVRVNEHYCKLRSVVLPQSVKERLRDTPFIYCIDQFDSVKDSTIQRVTNKDFWDKIIECYRQPSPDRNDGYFCFNGKKIVFTLQDVYYITGLPTDGKPITYSEKISDVEAQCLSIFGVVPNFDGKSKDIPLQWLIDYVQSAPETGNVDGFASAFILIIIGTLINPKTHGKEVFSKFLPFVKDIDDVGNYAWGSALFAVLTNSLAVRKGGTQTLYGHVFCLTVFFLERLVGLAKEEHMIKAPSNDVGFPLITKWYKIVAESNRPHKPFPRVEVLSQMLKEDRIKVKYTPYEALADIVVTKASESIVHRCRTLTTCFEKIAYNRPDLAYRQFGIEKSLAEYRAENSRAMIQTYNHKRSLPFYDVKEHWKERTKCLIDGGFSENDGNDTYDNEDDQEKEKQPKQTSHQHQSTRWKKKSDYAGSTTSGSEGKFQDLAHLADLQVDKRLEQVSNIQKFTAGQAESQNRNASTLEEGKIRECSKELVSSKKCKLEASSVAASQPHGSGLQGRTTPAPRAATSQPLGSGSQGRMTPNFQVDKRLEQVSNIQQIPPGQPESQKRNESTVEEGEIRESSKDVVSSKKCELEASSVAEQDHLEKRQTSNMEDVSSPVEGGDTNKGFPKNQKQDLLTHADKSTPGQSKPQKQSSYIVILDDDDDAFSAAEGDVKDAKSKEFVSSTGIDPAASVLSDFQDKGSRERSQILTMKTGPSTTGGDIMQVESQEIMSSVRNELEAPVLADSIEDGSSTSESGGGEMRKRKLHDQADNCSLTMSSLFDWASTFDDVSSSGARYQGSDHEMTTVKVGNYSVDKKHSATMDTIIKKYGDIAKDCLYTSTLIRSSAVQRACEVVEGLRMISLQQLSHDRLHEYACFLKEAAEMGLSVKWLEELVDDVSNAIQYLKEYNNIRDTQKGNMEKIEGLGKEIGLKVTKKRKCQNEAETLKCLYKAAKLEDGKKKKAMNDIKSRCKAISKRLKDGLY